MTDRFKEALGFIERLKFKTEYSLMVGRNTGADNSPKYKEYKNNYDCIKTIIEALTLAHESEQLRNDYTSMGVTLAARNSEIEQLRKERDELINGLQYLDALHNELGIVDLTKETARCREIAKKVNKNGNA